MIELLASTLRLSTPLLFAAMGGLLCERSGVATICLEGVMLVGAFVSATVTYYYHNAWLGLFVGMIMGSLFMGIHALVTLTARADQIVSGVAVNILAAGLTPLFCKSIFGSPTNSATIPLEERFNQPLLIAIALLLPFFLHQWIYRTTPGLRLLASGDGPEALRTSGVSPIRVRYIALLVGGAIASLGGVYLSTAHASQFTRDMTAGRGFIALTAVIFGKWKPIPAFLACLIFGFADAVQIQLQSTTLFGIIIPVQFIQAIPYAVTLIVLVGFIGRARPPLAIGKQ